jgi:hypothetical protein
MHGFNQPSILMATHTENQIQNSADFYYFFSRLVIETLQNQFIFNFQFFISLFGDISPGKKRLHGR